MNETIETTIYNSLENDIISKIELFKNREIKAKSIFTISDITWKTAYEFISKYHYLNSNRFLAKYSYGLFINGELVGCITYSNPQGTNTMMGWFGLKNSNQDVLEISRLCMLPVLNNSNATSYLLSNTIKILKQKNVKAIISLADSSKHVGSIYQICNFKYYGLSDSRSDFYTSSGKKNPRSQTKDTKGVWLQRTQKHRYCYIIDTDLKCLLNEHPKPLQGTIKQYDCCGGTHKVYDNRYGEWYSCPKCSTTFNLLDSIKFVN